MWYRLRTALCIGWCGIVFLGACGLAAQSSFAAFWKVFKAAAASGDRAAIAGMTRLPFYFEASITDRAALGPALDRLFDANARACFAKAKPMRDKNYYSVVCGRTIYGFDANEGPWRFTGIGAKE